MLRLHKYKSNPVPFHFSFFFKTPLNTKKRHKATSARRKSKRRARLNQRQQDIKKNAGKECSSQKKPTRKEQIGRESERGGGKKKET